MGAALLAAAACMGDNEFNDQPLGRRMALDAEGGAPRKAAPGPRDLLEVARHSSEGSCWLVLHGKVYDVTKFVPFHPGGSAILEGCGKDATRLFETRPMGSGTGHSSYAREKAKTYYLGGVQQGR